MPGLLDKPLVFVVGKGGVGRSTVAAALGLVAARRGKRAVVAEVAGQDQASQLLAVRDADPFAEHEVADGLFAISIDPQHAVREYLADQLPIRAMADLLGGSDTFAYFAAAAPGLHELVTIGKIWELAQPTRRTPGAEPYDVVIVDAPASGHAIGLMRTPKTFADVARVGPIARQAGKIDRYLSSRKRIGIAAVALPTDMAANETVQLAAGLRRDLRLGVDLLAINEVYPDRFSNADGRRLRGTASRNGAVPALARAAVLAALSEDRRSHAQRAVIDRLAGELTAPVTELPFLFRPELGRAGLEELADLIEESV